MRRTSLLLAVLVLALPSVPANGDTPANPRADQIDQLIARLAGQNFRDREAATRALEAIGEPALKALRQAAASKDMEVAERAKMLVERITARLENAARLVPTYVELKFKDTPIEQAVAELAKQSGSTVVLGPIQKWASGRTVTLDTGHVPFWVAVDKLCAAAGLHEAEPTSTVDSAQTRMQIQRQLGQQGQVITTYRATPPAAAQNLVLIDGKTDPVPTHIEGAVRIRSATTKASLDRTNPGEMQLGLEVQVEPRMGLERMLGIKVDKAVDDHGQVLEQVLVDSTPSAPATIEQERLVRLQLASSRSGMLPATHLTQPALVQLRLKKGDKESKALREVEGTIAVGLRMAEEELAVIEKPLAAKPGDKAKTKADVALQLASFTKLDNGDYQVIADLQYGNDIRPGTTHGNQILANGARLNVSNPYGLVLLGEKGQPFVASARSVRSRVSGGMRTMSITMTFRSSQDIGEPAKLVFSGSRSAPVEVPFVLKDVAVK